MAQIVIDLDSIIEQLETQKAAIERALQALRGEQEPRRRGRPAGTTTKNPAKKAPTRGGITEEGRAKLAEAMKKRWAAKQTRKRAAEKGATKKAAAKKTTTKQTGAKKAAAKQPTPTAA
jgi:hypothetical protein